MAAPHDVARGDQLRATAQGQLDEFVAEYRRQLHAGDDPNEVFTTLFDGTQMSIVLLGPRTAAFILTAAIERLATADEKLPPLITTEDGPR